MTPKQLRDSAPRPWPTPAPGQVWRINEDLWYIRRRLVDNPRFDFEAREVNGRRLAELTTELLEDADERFVAYMGTPEITYDA